MLYGIIFIIISVLLDRITKQLAVKFLVPIDSFPIIEDVLHFTYLENTGAAFGSLKNARWVFLAISTIAIIALLVYMIKVKPKSRLLVTGLSFIVGGGIGNMIDRVINGYVVDFIDFRLINFAIFNVADSFVCVGAALTVIYVLFFDRAGDERTEKKQ